ncbi:MAG: serine/threonine protein kinase [Prevotella sp.]|nr:serine/threonine protein kinase [Prevotella sp.]
MATTQQLSKGAIVKSPHHQYRILSVLGQGGFGITYLAETTTKVVSALQGELGQVHQTHEATIKVALKEFFMREVNGREGTMVTSSQKEGCFQKYLEKFKAEAHNLSRLQHPNIISVLELFSDNNTMYYAMEFVEGVSLQQKLAQEGPLSERQTMTMAKQIGDALAFMHSYRMLHLDLKPGNIMVRHDGTPLLIDFGLSKQYDEDGAPESSTTIGAGTKGYAPVEQVDYHGGMGFPVTLDVYAFGATLYKMLTGITPPAASEVMNDGLPMLPLQQHGVSTHTIQVIQKAMMPIKAMRYQSVGEMMADLSGVYMQNENTVIEQPSLTPPSPVNSFAKNDGYVDDEPQTSKSKTLKILLAVLIPLLLVGAIFIAYLLFSGNDDRRVAKTDDSEYYQDDEEHSVVNAKQRNHEDEDVNNRVTSVNSAEQSLFDDYVESPAEGAYFIGTIGEDHYATLAMPLDGSSGGYTFVHFNREVTFDSYNPHNHSLVLRAYDSSGVFIGRFVGTLENINACLRYKGVFTNTSGGQVKFNLRQDCD